MDVMKVLLAGGGTAGHVEPALAVGRALKESDPSTELLFLGTAGGLESSIIPAAGFALHLIPKVEVPRHLSATLLMTPFKLAASIRETMRALKGVDCAIGFGGYVSAPMYCAAFLKRVPFLIHEQNAKPGWANRIGAHLTPWRAISYSISKGKLKSATLTGLPLRADVLTALTSAAPDWSSARLNAQQVLRTRYHLSESGPILFIFGGSQGSQAINSVIDSSRAGLDELGISIIHGVGRNNPVPASSSHYVALPYIEEMALHYLAADIVISRSGAVTCAEFAALGRFALFIPLPVGNGEQALNAASLVSQSRAEIINQREFTPEWLEANLPRLLEKSSLVDSGGETLGISAADKIVQMIKEAAESR
ncbi:MAG: UDP-N-acetylglucosamine--N-acetylmuramyl-(pentapeptide) pyrophosphoryl-undecaprenol N-acetylglucosamine transferase [Actinobacteria bacterium]|nr:UDP-N-acetylglucosamine--N-acetylmuramyl-(pentapeptide) pyrophosphoryl-undecaprenol N-acetylglucosamine transferase [Actinomycetota bacterium]